MRPTEDQILCSIAELWAKRGTCSRLQVGAVLTRGSRIISSGYNGAPQGRPHCDHTSYESSSVWSGSCRRAVHAEANAIAFAASYGINTSYADCYVTHAPCYACAMLLIQGGVARVMYRDEYLNQEGLDLLRDNDVEIYEWSEL